MVRPAVSQPYHAGNSEDGKNGEGEADIDQQGIKNRGYHQQNGNGGLQANGGGRGVAPFVDPGKRGKKHPVFGHGIIDPGAGHDHGAQYREDSQRDSCAEVAADFIPEQVDRGFGPHVQHIAHLSGGHGVDVDRVDQKVQAHDGQGAGCQGDGDVFLRVLYLPADIGRRIPSAVGEGDKYEGDRKALRGKPALGPGHLKMRRGAAAE